MIAPDVKTAIARLRELVDDSEVIVPFTGAGISTECGIPDFRSPGGIWTKMRPIDFSDFLASQEARDESWRRRFAMEESFGGAWYTQKATELPVVVRLHGPWFLNGAALGKMRCAPLVATKPQNTTKNATAASSHLRELPRPM